MYAGFLVLSDNWHPDWKVFIDGQQEELYRANHTFRAAYVPAGKHEVVFVYISAYYNVGGVVSKIALIVLILLVLVIAIRKSRYSKLDGGDAK